MQDTAFQTQDCEETQTGMQLRLLYSKMPKAQANKSRFKLTVALFTIRAPY